MKKKFLLLIGISFLTGCCNCNAECSCKTINDSNLSSSSISNINESSTSGLTKEEKDSIKSKWLLAWYGSDKLDDLYKRVWGSFDYVGFAIENNIPGYNLEYVIETIYKHNIEGYEYAMPCALNVEFYKDDTLMYVLSFGNKYGSKFMDLDSFNPNDYEFTYEIKAEKGTTLDEEQGYISTIHNNYYIYIDGEILADQRQFVIGNYCIDAENEISDPESFTNAIKNNLRLTQFHIGDEYPY